MLVLYTMKPDTRLDMVLIFLPCFSPQGSKWDSILTFPQVTFCVFVKSTQVLWSLQDRTPSYVRSYLHVCLVCWEIHFTSSTAWHTGSEKTSLLSWLCLLNVSLCTSQVKGSPLIHCCGLCVCVCVCVCKCVSVRVVWHFWSGFCCCCFCCCIANVWLINKLNKESEESLF